MNYKQKNILLRECVTELWRLFCLLPTNPSIYALPISLKWIEFIRINTIPVLKEDIPIQESGALIKHTLKHKTGFNIIKKGVFITEQYKDIFK